MPKVVICNIQKICLNVLVCVLSIMIDFFQTYIIQFIMYVWCKLKLKLHRTLCLQRQFVILTFTDSRLKCIGLLTYYLQKNIARKLHVIFSSTMPSHWLFVISQHFISYRFIKEKPLFLHKPDLVKIVSHLIKGLHGKPKHHNQS